MYEFTRSLTSDYPPAPPSQLPSSASPLPPRGAGFVSVRGHACRGAGMRFGCSLPYAISAGPAAHPRAQASRISNLEFRSRRLKLRRASIGLDQISSMLASRAHGTPGFWKLRQSGHQMRGLAVLTLLPAVEAFAMNPGLRAPRVNLITLQAAATLPPPLRVVDDDSWENALESSGAYPPHAHACPSCGCTDPGRRRA